MCRQLKQLWGVHPLLLALDQDPERTIEAAEAELVRRKLVEPGDRLVIVSDLLAGKQRFASIQFRTVAGRAAARGVRTWVSPVPASTYFFA